MSKNLNYLANKARFQTLKMIIEAKSGHPGSSLGLVDFFVAMYFRILQHRPNEPSWQDRDRLVVSCGHVAPIYYATLAMSGYFPLEKLMTLRKIGSSLQGHPNHLDLPGIENSSGPLGQGASIAVGMALAGKKQEAKHQVYLLMSDGEQDEGQVWEAVMLASKYQLDNLIAFVDRNHIQISGKTETVMPLENLKRKYLAFNWQVFEADGHKISDIIKKTNRAKQVKGRPTVIILRTHPGQGVSFMEDQASWHGKAPKGVEAEQALEELKKLVMPKS